MSTELPGNSVEINQRFFPAPQGTVETLGYMPSTKLQSHSCTGNRDADSWALMKISQKAGPRPCSDPGSAQNVDEPTGKAAWEEGLLKGMAPCKDIGIERHRGIIQKGFEFGCKG